MPLMTRRTEPVTENGPVGNVERAPAGRGRRGAARGALARLAPYGPVIILLVAVAVFALAKPDTFATGENFRAILSQNAVLAIAALAVTVPIICGQFDLSVAGNMASSGLVAAGLMSFSHVTWPLALAAGLAAGLVVGATNGFLVAYGGVHSFIATLGTQTLLFGFALWYSRGTVVFKDVDASFVSLTHTRVFALPMTVFYMAIVAALLWFTLSYTPFGRYLYAIGGNRAAAKVAGVPVKRHIFYSLVVSGGLVGIAGVILASQNSSAQSTAGDTYLLPAFAAAFIGASTFRKGEFNVGGTLVGVYLVSVLVSGAFAIGAQFYVASLISGFALIVAVLGSKVMND